MYQHQDINPVREFYVVGLNRLLKKGENYKIQLKYQGKFNETKIDGIHITKDRDGDNLVATKFQPNSARKVFPCFDEPAMKAAFQMTIGRPSGYRSISNMSEKKMIQKMVDGEEYVEDVYEVKH